MATDGRLAVVLDPVGYSYAKEEGFAFSYDANTLWEHGVLLPNDFLWSAPGSPWLMPRLKQFRPDWWKDSERVTHLLQRSDWVLAAGIQPPTDEYLSARNVGEAIPAGDVWYGYYVPPDVGANPMLCNFYTDDAGANITSISTALKNAVNENLRPNMHVAASSTEVFEGDRVPFWHVGTYPVPDDQLLLGFGKILLVMTAKQIHVLKTTDDHQNWIYLNSTGTGDAWHRFKTKADVDIHPVLPGLGGGIVFVPHVHDVRIEEFACIPVGLDELFLAGYRGEGHMMALRRTQLPRTKTNIVRGGTQIGVGRWWVGCVPDRQLFLQTEICAAEVGQHMSDFEMLNPPGSHPLQDRESPIMFDLGSGYKPTPPPQIHLDGLLHSEDADFHTETIDTSGGRVFGRRLKSDSSGEVIEVRLLDTLNEPFDNSGDTPEHSAGRVMIKLQPSGNSERWPQMLVASFRWPPVLVARARQLGALGESEVIIEDETSGPEVGINTATIHWQNLKVSGSLLDLLGKTMELEIVDTVSYGVSTTVMDLFDRRQRFPIEIRERTSGGDTGDYDKTRIAAWVDKIDRQDIAWEDSDGDGLVDTVTRVWKLHCYGLMHRCDQPWLFLHAVEDPDNEGKLSHVESIRKAIFQSGFDVNDVNVLLTDDDSAEPDELKYLPGYSKHRVAVSGMRKRKNPYAPDPHQRRTDYMETVAKAWSGWRLCERLTGQFRYQRDLITRIWALGANPEMLPVPRAKFYLSHDEAEANASEEDSSGHVPYLIVLADPPPERFLLAVQGNAIRVSGKADQGSLIPTIVMQNRPSIDGPVTDENFVGEAKIVAVELDFAVDEGAMSQIARAMLHDLLLRGELLKWATPLPPWACTKIEGGSTETTNDSLDVGDPCEVDVYGKYIIVHTELAVNSRDDRVTIYTGWHYPTPRLPPPDPEVP